MSLLKFSALPARPLFPGATGRYAHTEKMTLGEVDLAASAVVPPHSHPHDQFSYVLAGHVEFTVGSETRVLGPGECAVVPGGTSHGARALTACRILDAFAPVREDFR